MLGRYCVAIVVFIIALGFYAAIVSAWETEKEPLSMSIAIVEAIIITYLAMSVLINKGLV